MFYKGYQWRRNPNVVAIPCTCDKKDNHVGFGRICAPGVKGSIMTDYVYKEIGGSNEELQLFSTDQSV